MQRADNDLNVWREVDLWKRFEEVQQRVELLERRVEMVEVSSIPPIVNFVLNGSASYSHFAYTAEDWSTDSDFTEEQETAAHWYNVAQGVVGAFSYHTPTTESSYGLITSSHPDWASRNQDAAWDKAKGEFQLGGQRSLLSPLSKNFAFPGQRVYVQMEVALASGASITDSHQLELALWEDADAVIESEPFDLTLASVGGGSGTPYHYTLEIRARNGTFRSNSTSVSGPASLSPSQYISAAWPPHLGVIEYKLYRSTDGGSTWKLVAVLPNTSFYDTSLSVGTTAAPPAQVNPVALVRVNRFGESLTEEFQKVSVSVPVPPKYLMPSSGERHVLRVSVVDSDGAAVTIGARALLVKMVGVSYTYGSWNPAPEDLSPAIGGVETTNPTPTITPPGEDPPPGDGGCPAHVYWKCEENAV